ncbi:MAG: ABC transporter permease [Thermomicrobiales bacterium]|nr:ABC transporter permease [Thermomicrobiales bacterium]
MRPLLAMIVANLKMTMRNRGAIFWNLLFPAIFIVIFGMVFGNDQTITIAVGVTGADSEYRQQVTYVFTEGDEFDLHESTDRAALMADLEDGELDAVVEFGESADNAFPPAVVHYNQANGPTADIVNSVIQQVLMGVAQAESPLEVTLEPVNSDSVSFIEFFVPGIVAMSLMNSGMIGLSTTFTTWRERGILRRMRLTPFPLPSFLLARILSQVVVAFAQTLILIGLATLLFDYRPTGNIFVITIAILAVSLAFLAIGFAISSVARTTESAAGISNLLVFPMLFLSGVFFETDSAPEWIQPLTRLLPLRFAVDALREPMTRGAGLIDIWQPLLALGVIFALALAFAARFFRWDSRAA